MTSLTPQQQYHIEQVAATMAIEDMPLDTQAYRCLEQLASGEKNINQIIYEITKEYT